MQNLTLVKAELEFLVRATSLYEPYSAVVLCNGVTNFEATSHDGIRRRTVLLH